MVLAVGDDAAYLMQACGPCQFACRTFAVDGCRLGEKSAGHAGNPFGLGHVHCEPLHEPVHGGGSQIGFGLLPLQQVVERALAQCALSRMHLPDFEKIKHRPQHTDAPRQSLPAGLP